MFKLTGVQEKFILHWGEMGTRWGINRTVAQVHALLYLSPRPLNAEEIAEALSVARSNVSTSLKELQAWGLVKVIHDIGDRRDHFESMQDVWEMFRVVLDERKRREVDPTMALLKECMAAAEQAGSEENYSKERLAQMLEFFETMSSWYEQMRGMPTDCAVKFAKLGGKIQKLLGLAS